VSPAFNANDIRRFSVIRIPYRFDSAGPELSKLFVVVAHLNNHAICIKTTSDTQGYDNDKIRMAGCVYYLANVVPCFPANTAVQPDNQHAISHIEIQRQHAAGKVTITPLPADFQARLQQAVKDSDSLSGRERTRISAIIK
jgi:hypothetical protein